MTSTPPQPRDYVMQMAALLELPLTSDAEAEVVENWIALTKVAERVLEFPLPDQIEAAPTFQP